MRNRERANLMLRDVKAVSDTSDLPTAVPPAGPMLFSLQGEIGDIEIRPCDIGT
jgi:hypothetical protein